MPEPTSASTASPLAGRYLAFVGKLGGVTRKEAQQLVRHHGGITVDRDDPRADLIVIGADELPLGESAVAELLAAESLSAADANRSRPREIITETQLWQLLGMVEDQPQVRRLYTPAMLADLLHVPVNVIRRWHRCGLIVPVKEVHRLPYFDFQQIAAARRVAQWLAAGMAPAAIERQLKALCRWLPEAERPLAQLSVIVQDQRLLLQQEAGLLEPRGQYLLNFEQSSDDSPPDSTVCDTAVSLSIVAAEEPESVVALPLSPGPLPSEATPDQLLRMAAELEDQGQLTDAIEMYRTVLMAGGPKAEVCFMLAELLYRMGDISAARERYYAAIECDEDFVEARANLGCVLAELGQHDLAIAAFQGALSHHPDYADAHYHLGRLLDEVTRHEQAQGHWQAFVQLAPDSPWASEAHARLSAPPQSSYDRQ